MVLRCSAEGWWSEEGGSFVETPTVGLWDPAQEWVGVGGQKGTAEAVPLTGVVAWQE